MDTIILTFGFFLVVAVYVALHIRAGLAEDAEWSRQLALTGHGVRLGLSSEAFASERVRISLVEAVATPVPNTVMSDQEFILNPSLTSYATAD